MKYTIKLTEQECKLIFEVLNTQINWGEGGCLINEEGEADEKQIKTAKDIVYKIRNRNYSNNKIKI
jgi:hypothetical protein